MVQGMIEDVKRCVKSSYGPMLIIKAPMSSMKCRGNITNVLQRTISRGASSLSKGSENQVRPIIMDTRVIRIIKSESQVNAKAT